MRTPEEKITTAQIVSTRSGTGILIDGTVFEVASPLIGDDHVEIVLALVAAAKASKDRANERI